MKKILATAAALAMLGASSAAFAAEYTKGKVTKVDVAQKKITIKHEELKSLDMPAMTMVFAVAKDELMAKVKAGATIQFVAERVNGRIMVTEIQ
jgi:Cu/Ag efflux protein CusF